MVTAKVKNTGAKNIKNSSEMNHLDGNGTGRVQLSEIAEEPELKERKEKTPNNQLILVSYANQYALDQRQRD